VLLSPAFGAFLLARNWKAIGRPDRAFGSLLWAWGFIVFLTLNVLLDTLLASGIVPMPPATTKNADIALTLVSQYGSMAILAFWAWTQGSEQVKFVEETLGNNYIRKKWAPPLLAGMTAVGLFVATVYALGTVAYRLNTVELAAEVMPMILSELQKKPELKAIAIHDVTLVHKEGNMFSGFINVALNGETERIPLEVTHDGKTISWQLRPSATAQENQPTLDEKQINELIDRIATFIDQSKPREALPLAQELLRLTEQTPDEKQLRTGAALNFLAMVYHIMGDYDRAKPLAERAATIFKTALEPEHPMAVANKQLCDAIVAQSMDDDDPPQAAGMADDPPGTVMNSIGMKFVPISAGEFLMGSPGNDSPGDNNEEFQHRVRIATPFFMGMHEVTQKQYEQVTGENPSQFQGHDLPVEHLFWKQAAQFCNLLSELPAERQAGRRYRLPTEAEWEYACRAGTATIFNTGDEIHPSLARFSGTIRFVAKKPAPVGTYAPNAWGLFDMHGNVWEWTADWFSADYFHSSPTDDPLGPSSGTHHTLRGGSASVKSDECRSSIRGEAGIFDGPNGEGSVADARYSWFGDFGVRVVCVLQDGK